MLQNVGKLIFSSLLLMFLSEGLAYCQSREVLQTDVDVINLSQQVKLLQSSVDRIDQENVLLKGLVEKITDQVNNLSASLQKMNQTVTELSVNDGNASAESRVILTNLSKHVNELQSGLSRSEESTS